MKDFEIGRQERHVYSSNGGYIVPFLDQTKIPQKFFVDHDRYLHQKVRADNSTNFFQRIDQPKGNQYRKMRGKFVWFSTTDPTTGTATDATESTTGAMYPERVLRAAR